MMIVHPVNGGAAPHHAAKHLIVKGRDDPPLNNLHAVRRGRGDALKPDRSSTLVSGNAMRRRRTGGNKMWSIPGANYCIFISY